MPVTPDTEPGRDRRPQYPPPIRGLKTACAVFVLVAAGTVIRPAHAEQPSADDDGVPASQVVTFVSSTVEASESADPSSNNLLAELDEPDKSYWSEKRINDYAIAMRDATPDDMPEGLMHLPSIGLEFPVFSGTAEKYLTLGAGRVEGTAPLGTPGNTGIASHRDGFFRALKDVKVGDSIQVRTLSGKQEFRIVELFIVDPEDAYVLYPTEEDAITLVTCYPFYHVGHAPQRYIVRAHRTTD